MARSLPQLRARRDEIGDDLDHALDARDEVRHRKATAKEKDPATEHREKVLDARIAELSKQEHELTIEIKRLRRQDENLRERIARKVKELAQRINLTPGAPHWGGSDDLIRKYADPVAAQYGAPVTSRKRAADHPLTLQNPGSDHSETQPYASAADYGTYTGDGLARAIARAFGILNYTTGSYTGHYVEFAGKTFRVQILWAVAGHFNHVHNGVRRVD